MSVAALPTALPLPLSPEQGELLQRLTDGLDGSALWWLSGYAAGLARGQGHSAPAPVPATAPSARLTVVYGSQTGNARRVAEALAERVRDAGLAVRLLRADAYPLRELKDERYLAIVISTQGDGDPPDDALGFVEHLSSARAPKLEGLRFAVFGLGDSSYPQFCAVGRQIDARLEALGASRWLPRVDADLDVERVCAPWLQQALDAARDALRTAAPMATVTPLRPAPQAAAHGRDRPFAAPLLANQRITGRGSTRDVRHLEISLEGAGLRYEPGDALGVWPRNAARLVDEVLAVAGLDGGTAVAIDGSERPLREWLTGQRELTRLSRPLLAAHAERARDPAAVQALLDDPTALVTRLADWQLPDLLRAFPAAWSADALVQALRPLTPRLYSIASSMKAVGEEAHLTVAHVQYALGGAARFGAASHLLAETAEGGALPVFVEPNERFRLPADPTRDVLMIGPGTGVAPFRGFVQERHAIGASGRHWLLFGNPHFRTDFLYQLEWQEALRSGALDRLDLAFSRDGAGKTYVQHRLLEHGREVYAWLESGAHLYVCGATAMARDVEQALRKVIATHGGRTPEAAREYLQALQAQGRYARDVY